MKGLKDTVDLMLSDNWEDRLRAEIYQCQIRREKLAVNLHNADRYDPLYEMYQSQLVHMLDYECDLTNRAAVLGVELESVMDDSNSLKKKLGDWREMVKQSNCCCCAYTSPESPFDAASFMLGSLFGMELGKDGDKK